jgi:hypothetical protein
LPCLRQHGRKKIAPAEFPREASELFLCVLTVATSAATGCGDSRESIAGLIRTAIARFD